MKSKTAIVGVILGMVMLSRVWSDSVPLLSSAPATNLAAQATKSPAAPTSAIPKQTEDNVTWTISAAYVGGYLTPGGGDAPGYGGGSSLDLIGDIVEVSDTPIPVGTPITTEYSWGNGFELSAAFGYSEASNIGLLADYFYFHVGHNTTRNAQPNIFAVPSAISDVLFSSVTESYHAPYLQRADLLISFDFLRKKGIVFQGSAGIDGFFLSHSLDATHTYSEGTEYVNLKEVMAGAGPKVDLTMTTLFKEVFGLRGMIGFSSPVLYHKTSVNDYAATAAYGYQYYENTKGSYTQLEQIIDAELDLVYHFGYGEASYEIVLGWKTFQAPTISNLLLGAYSISDRNVLNFSALVIELNGTF